MTCYEQNSIRQVVVDHFKSLFSYPKGLNLMDQLNTIQHFPRFFDEEDHLSVDRSMTMSEVKNILNMFMREKIQGPDDWTVKFHCHFFNLVVRKF